MHDFGHAQFLILALMIDIVFLQTFSMVSPIYSVVSISLRVDLTENIGMYWFCIVSVFRLDTLPVKEVHVEPHVIVGVRYAVRWSKIKENVLVDECHNNYGSQLIYCEFERLVLGKVGNICLFMSHAEVVHS